MITLIGKLIFNVTKRLPKDQHVLDWSHEAMGQFLLQKPQRIDISINFIRGKRELEVMTS